MPRTARPAVHPRAQLYAHPTDPMAWVAPDLEATGLVWTWSRITDGWITRTRYRGSLRELLRMEAHHAFTTGWPGARPEPKSGKVRAPKPPKPTLPLEERLIACVRTMLSPREAQALLIAAHARELTASAYLRAVLFGEVPALSRDKAIPSVGIPQPEDLL
jgi:hypothetical protein